MKKILFILVAIFSINIAFANTNEYKVPVTIDNKTFVMDNSHLFKIASILEETLPEKDLQMLYTNITKVQSEKVKTYKYKNMVLHFNLNEGLIIFNGFNHVVKIQNIYTLTPFFKL